MAKRGRETCTVKRSPTKGRTGDVTPGAVVGDLTACIIWPRFSSEDSERGTRIIEGYTVFAPAPVAIEVRATDTITARGDDWNIDGAPGDWRSKNGRKIGLMVMLKRSGT